MVRYPLGFRATKRQEHAMPIVVVANPKGGVGKSTLTSNVAGWFASRGKTF